MSKRTQLVVVHYDAGNNSLTPDLNPVVLLPGSTKIFFALRTINGGQSAPALFTTIKVVNQPSVVFAAVDGLQSLFAGTIDNKLKQGDSEQVLEYELCCEYPPLERSQTLDPSIVLLPPTGGP